MIAGCLFLELLFTPNRMAKGSLVAMPNNEVDMSLQAWLLNTREVLGHPATILTVISLLVVGTFTEIAPRKSLELLDGYFGRILFFVVPILIAVGFDWAIGLLATVVSLIIFARIQKSDDEGFVDKKTDIITQPHRWFVEKLLGERPIAISSDRIITRRVEDEDNRTSSSSSMSTHGNSDGNKSDEGKSDSLF